jgi:hypothetical protein
MILRVLDFFGTQAADVGPFAISTGRFGAIVAVVTGLSGAIVGALALRARRKGTARGKRGPAFALAAGVIGVALGTLVVASAGGGLGTGHGFGGGVVALVIGTISLIFGGFAGAQRGA